MPLRAGLSRHLSRQPVDRGLEEMIPFPEMGLPESAWGRLLVPLEHRQGHKRPFRPSIPSRVGLRTRAGFSFESCFGSTVGLVPF